MSEIKTRLSYVRDTLLTLRPSANPPPEAYMLAEATILQIRLVCELIGLAAAVAHHHLGLSKDLLKSWHMERTFGWLEKVNPDCFPRAINPIEPGPRLNVVLQQDRLNRHDLEKIYVRCGELLHRGALKAALTGGVRDYNMTMVNKWAEQIHDLLSHHIVIPQKAQEFWIVRLHSPPDGAVEVVTLVKPTSVTDLNDD
ncbi:hypothetical protein [Sphingobium sp. CAP-1]|uniref:hypothetical protein n=1 Tax=Sphingobium sp. CAP-1 TaxID=2676077 RepID=UPI0012BB1EEF|nr:hypothetical protein [Sphingobium sp. CAP-1]QGP79703.1 hypothetical protein GL174_12495 [Sphingobium sp. CAP-1]